MGTMFYFPLYVCLALHPHMVYSPKTKICFPRERAGLSDPLAKRAKRLYAHPELSPREECCCHMPLPPQPLCDAIVG